MKGSRVNGGLNRRLLKYAADDFDGDDVSVPADAGVGCCCCCCMGDVAVDVVVDVAVSVPLERGGEKAAFVVDCEKSGSLGVITTVRKYGRSSPDPARGAGEVIVDCYFFFFLFDACFFDGLVGSRRDVE